MTYKIRYGFEMAENYSMNVRLNIGKKKKKCSQLQPRNQLEKMAEGEVGEKTDFFIQVSIQEKRPPWFKETSPQVPLWVEGEWWWLAWITCRWSLDGMGSDRSWKVSRVEETCMKRQILIDVEGMNQTLDYT